MISLRFWICINSLLLAGLSWAGSSSSDFGVPKGYSIDLRYYEISGEISLRKLLPDGQYAAISFRNVAPGFELESLNEIGFNLIEICGRQSAIKKLDGKLVEYSALVSPKVYVHGVNLTQDDVMEIERFFCNGKEI